MTKIMQKLTKVSELNLLEATIYHKKLGLNIRVESSMKNEGSGTAIREIIGKMEPEMTMIRILVAQNWNGTPLARRGCGRSTQP